MENDTYLQLVIKLPLEPSPPITSMLPSNFRSGGGPAFLGLPGLKNKNKKNRRQEVN